MEQEGCGRESSILKRYCDDRSFAWPLERGQTSRKSKYIPLALDCDQYTDVKD